MAIIGQFVHDILNVKGRLFKVLTEQNTLNIKVTNIFNGTRELFFEFSGEIDDDKMEFVVYAREQFGGNMTKVGDMKFDSFIMDSWIFTLTHEGECVMVRGYDKITLVIHEILKLQLSND